MCNRQRGCEIEARYRRGCSAFFHTHTYLYHRGAIHHARTFRSSREMKCIDIASSELFFASKNRESPYRYVRTLCRAPCARFINQSSLINSKRQAKYTFLTVKEHVIRSSFLFTYPIYSTLSLYVYFCLATVLSCFFSLIFSL